MIPYFEEAGIQIFHGDCREILPGLGLVDHCISDPPYALTVVNTSMGAPRGRRSKATRRDLAYVGISDDYRSAIGMEMGRLVRRWALVFCDAESLTAWREALEAGGLRHMRMGAWVSPACTPQFSGDRPGTGWQACEIAHGHGRSWWNGGGSPAVWIVNRPVNASPERIETGHPTPKPVALMTTLVEDFTDPGDLVLDPFMGSGTTLVACKRLARRAIGIELNEAYCEIAANRLRQAVLPLTPAPLHTQADLLGGDAA